MKNLIILALMLLTSISFAQKDRTLELNKDTNLIDVVYYHDNGVVSQTGSYTLDGKLHGEWMRFDIDGNKVVNAEYENGKKVGKWFYWSGDKLKEVDYTKNDIVSVNEWVNSASVVSSN